MFLYGNLAMDFKLSYSYLGMTALLKKCRELSPFENYLLIILPGRLNYTNKNELNLFIIYGKSDTFIKNM